MASTLFFAVAGDVHGRWAEFAHDVDIAASFLPEGARLAAVLQLGDAEPTADAAQLAEVHIKPERRALSDFAEVLAGRVRFAAPVYFIGGNHEPWRTLDRNGGLVQGGAPLAPGVHFLGRAGAVELSGVRIGFLSGIRHADGRPFTLADRLRLDTIESANYYTVEELARTAKCGPVDLLLTHERPTGTGFVHKLSETGDPAVRRLLGELRPAASFHGHHHRADEAVVDGVRVFAMGLTGQGVPEAVSVFAWDPDTRSVSRLRHVRTENAVSVPAASVSRA